jgi:hypothetical protein
MCSFEVDHVTYRFNSRRILNGADRTSFPSSESQIVLHLKFYIGDCGTSLYGILARSHDVDGKMFASNETSNDTTDDATAF